LITEDICLHQDTKEHADHAGLSQLLLLLKPTTTLDITQTTETFIPMSLLKKWSTVLITELMNAKEDGCMMLSRPLLLEVLSLKAIILMRVDMVDVELLVNHTPISFQLLPTMVVPGLPGSEREHVLKRYGIRALHKDLYPLYLTPKIIFQDIETELLTQVKLPDAPLLTTLLLLMPGNITSITATLMNTL